MKIQKKRTHDQSGEHELFFVVNKRKVSHIHGLEAERKEQNTTCATQSTMSVIHIGQTDHGFLGRGIHDETSAEKHIALEFGHAVDTVVLKACGLGDLKQKVAVYRQAYHVERGRQAEELVVPVKAVRVAKYVVGHD